MIRVDKKPLVCNKCSGAFAIDIKREELTGLRVGYYFSCPHCGKKYPAYSITAKGEKLLKQLNKVRGKLKSNPALYRPQFVRLLEKYQKEVSGPYQESEVL